jgi:hypothetical protein
VVTVFAVWEPILPTDWAKPGTSVLARLSDHRVRQFWDPGHAVAAILRRAGEAANLHAACCFRKGILWDFAAAYPPGAPWRDVPAGPILFDGTIVRVAPGLTAAIAATK